VAYGGVCCGGVDGCFGGFGSDEHLDVDDAAGEGVQGGGRVEVVEREVGEVEVDLARAERAGGDVGEGGGEPGVCFGGACVDGASDGTACEEECCGEEGEGAGV